MLEYNFKVVSIYTIAMTTMFSYEINISFKFLILQKILRISFHPPNIHLNFYLKENDSLAKDFVHGPAKQILKSLKSNSTEVITSGEGSSSWDDPYVSYTFLSSLGLLKYFIQDYQILHIFRCSDTIYSNLNLQ